MGLARRRNVIFIARALPASLASVAETAPILLSDAFDNEEIFVI